jgi:hypothetical protein
MARGLKGGMPKLFADNRCPDAKRLREIYQDIAKRFPLEDGLSRRIAGMTGMAWLNYEQLGREVAKLTSKRLKRSGKGSMDVQRLRRRQGSYAGAFLGGHPTRRLSP